MSSGELVHYGKKGMRWGIRQAQADAAVTRSFGTAGLAERMDRDKALGLKPTLNDRLVYGRHPAEKLHRKADAELAYAHRVATGKTSTRDTLKQIGRFSMTDVKRGRRIAKRTNAYNKTQALA